MLQQQLNVPMCGVKGVGTDLKVVLKSIRKQQGEEGKREEDVQATDGQGQDLRVNLGLAQAENGQVPGSDECVRLGGLFGLLGF